MRKAEGVSNGGNTLRSMPFAGIYLNGVPCVRTMLGQYDAASFAGFPCTFQLEARAKYIMDGGHESLADKLKIQKLAKELSPTEDECNHMSVAATRRLAIFTGSRKVGKTEYSGKGTRSYKEWRDESNGVGYAYDLKRALLQVEEDTVH